MMEQITVLYQTHPEDCEKCKSEVREFDIKVKDLLEWAGWKSKEHVYEEEVKNCVWEYLSDTIRFFAVDGNNEVYIAKEELVKVENEVRKHFLALPNTI